MKTLRKILILSIASVLMAGCYATDDDYSAAKEIKVAGVESVYNKTAIIDVLHIEPVITTTDPDDDLEYQWRMWPDYSGASQVPDNLVVTTIGTERVLDYQIVDKPQTYRVELKVTDKTTGQEAYALTTLNVTNEFSKGFYVLKGVGGGTDMDLHAPDGALMADVIEKVQGQPLPGTPVSLSVLPAYCYIDTETMENQTSTTLNAATSEGFWIVDIGDLGVAYDLESMFYFAPEPGMSLFSVFVYYGAVYYSDKGAYYTTYDVIYGYGGSGKFGTALPIAGGYRPNINVTTDGYYNYFFDELNGRFLTVDYNGGFYACSDQDTGGGTPEVSPNNIPDKMLYFGRNKIGTNKPSGFAVMQHPSDQSKRYLYEMTLDGLTTNPMISKTEITGLHLNQAELFACNEIQARYLYCVDGGEVYCYQIGSGTEEKLTLQGFGAGEQIKYIKNLYWTGASTEDGKFNYLAIGTQSGGDYKVYLYNLVAGLPVGAPAHVLAGEGEVSKVQYITPDFTYEIGDFQYPLGY